MEDTPRQGLTTTSTRTDADGSREGKAMKKHELYTMSMADGMMDCLTEVE